MNKAEGRTIRKYSSTRGDFLDLAGNYLSVGSSSAISEMSGSENQGAMALPVICDGCGFEMDSEVCVVCQGIDSNPVNKVMLKAMSDLSKEIKSLRLGLDHYDKRLEKVEKCNGIDHRKHRASSSKKKDKKSRVDEEGSRQLGIMKDYLRELNKNNGVSTDGDEPSSFKDLDKRMSKSQKEECQRKLSASLEYVGANFPEDDFDDPSSSSSSSSGRDSSDSDSHRKCRKKKVK